MKPNNYYYRQIAELVTGETYLKFFSSMYYMRKIAEHYKEETYSTIKSSNKYLKDWYVELTDEEEPQTHKFNLWYLRRIAKFLDNTITENSLNENQCLQVIMDNTSTTTSVKLSGLPSSAIVDTAITLTVTVKDEHRSPISGASVTIEEDGEELTTVTTGSDGTQTYTYTPSVASSHTITATYDEYSDEKSITVSKHTTSISCEIAPTTLNYGGTLTAMGTLYIDGEPAPADKRVYIYDGSTLLGYDDTASNGAFRYDKNNVTTIGTMSVKAVYETDATHTGYETTPVTVTVSKRTPYLSLGTPIIVYDDPFTVTGTLKTSSNGSPISDASVTLTYSIGSGVSQTVSDTTNSSGTVTFNMSAPDSMTSYSFMLDFDGNNEFNPVSSDPLYDVDVEKKGTILTLNSPTSGAVISTGDLSVSGTLTDDDASPKALAGKTILAKIGKTTIGTFTTYGNDGIFSGYIENSELSIGYNTINFNFEGTSEYYGDAVTGISVRKVASPYTAIDISADNSILSYADSESATITAQLVDSNDDPVALEDVQIDLYKDGVYWDSDYTDSTGKVQKSYSSAGVGDVVFGADDGTLATVTTTVEDCRVAHMSTYLDGYESERSVSVTFDDVLQSTFKIEFDLLYTQSTNNTCFVRIGETENKALLVGKVGSADSVWKIYARNGTDIITTGSSIPIGNDWIPITLSFDGTTFKFNDDITITNFNGISLTKLLSIISYKKTTASGQIRNIKIKPYQSINIDVDNPVLSYADSTQENPQTATLTATVNPVASGRTVQIFKDDVLVATETTDSQGQVSYEYTSQGVGDVEFEFKCGALTETYIVQDYYYYDSLTTDKSRYTTISGTPSLTYSSDGLEVNTSVAQVALIRNNFITLPNNYEAEITITYNGNNVHGSGICFDDWLLDSGEYSKCVSYKLSNTSKLSDNLAKFNTGDVVKIVKQGTSISYYLNGTLVVTNTISNDNHYQQFRTYQNRKTVFKDLKIKQL